MIKRLAEPISVLMRDKLRITEWAQLLINARLPYRFLTVPANLRSRGIFSPSALPLMKIAPNYS